jgi:3',5'-cyclic AMP phosphodiesterase CpdA
MSGRRLWAWSDLHVSYREARQEVARVRPESPDDWLVVAGDVGELAADVERCLAVLAARYARVIWVPGNHELWTHPRDPVTLRGEERYRYLVDRLRAIGVTTPEDEYPVWADGEAGPLVVVPMFLLYDYSFRAPGTTTTRDSLAAAYAAGVVARDEDWLHPDPHPTREAWCRARVELTRRRLDALDPRASTVLVNHFPVVRAPTDVLRYPTFAQWCGTTRTADWPVRYRARAVVYGHLHIPRRTVHDGVPHLEVSLGYPREWPMSGGPLGPRPVL